MLEEGSGPHFMGSTVMKQFPGTAEGVTPNLVIDGQQRLTTLTILLAALRDVASEGENEEETKIAEKIHELYLTNKYADGLARYKLVPTQDDRPGYFGIIDSEPVGEGGIRAAHAYFLEAIRNAIQEGIASLEEFEHAIVRQLELVSITLGESDNEYRIFESLNAKGEPLSQSDLVRNHFFMRIPDPDDQERVYRELWLPMERALGTSLADYFRNQLQAEGQFVKQGDIYAKWKSRLSEMEPGELVSELERLNSESLYYRRLLDPAAENERSISDALRRINQWRGETVYPFLLNIYRAYSGGAIEAEGFVAILRLLESFLVRRFFCGVPTNQLNRLFLRLYQQLSEGEPLPEATRQTLSDPGKRWPSNDDFRECLMRFSLYSNGRPQQRKLILDTLARATNGKEHADLSALTIEHIMPQKLTPEWEEELGDDAERVYTEWLHRLGNLTLTGYNPELSNSPFATKRELLRESNLQMNRVIAESDAWSEAEMESRADYLANVAIDVWLGPYEVAISR